MKQPSFWKRHSLSVTSGGILFFWFLVYLKLNPQSHIGSFFGNAIADWTGVVITILITKFLFEKGSKESRSPQREHSNAILEFFHEHSLTIFLFLTGLGWAMLFWRADPGSRWGSVAGSLVSEWSQQIGLVLLTKKLIESGSKESRG